MAADIAAVEKAANHEAYKHLFDGDFGAMPELYPEWNSTVQYQIGDKVRHNGKMWIATSSNTNNEPDDVPGDWDLIPK